MSQYRTFEYLLGTLEKAGMENGMDDSFYVQRRKDVLQFVGDLTRTVDGLRGDVKGLDGRCIAMAIECNRIRTAHRTLNHAWVDLLDAAFRWAAKSRSHLSTASDEGRAKLDLFAVVDRYTSTTPTSHPKPEGGPVQVPEWPWLYYMQRKPEDRDGTMCRKCKGCGRVEFQHELGAVSWLPLDDKTCSECYPVRQTYIPDPIERGEAAAEKDADARMIDATHWRCFCGKVFDLSKEGGPASASPYAPALCGDCLETP